MLFEHFLEKALRRGVVPGCCGSASFCFALYSIKVSKIADQWELQALATTAKQGLPDSSSCRLEQENYLYFLQNRAQTIRQHAGTCVALSAISAASTWQAMIDWRQYRRLANLDDMEYWLGRRRLFMLRSPVLATAIVSLGLVEVSLQGICLWQSPTNLQPPPPLPLPPLLQPSGKR